MNKQSAAKPGRPAARKEPNAVAGAPAVTPLADNANIVQRKSCACGGACPRCAGQQPIQTKRATGSSPTAGTSESTHHTGMPASLKENIEAASGVDFSGVRVHANSALPARVDALAYTQGPRIYLGPGQERHLAHEAWHVVQQMQGRVQPAGLERNNLAINNDPALEAEADRMAVRLSGPAPPVSTTRLHSSTGIGSSPAHPVQRKVRIGGGATRVPEADYLPGGSKSSIGSRFSVASLIGDSIKRVFLSVAELENYANGRTDYIGDVATSGSGTFWYRLPQNQLTVLGEGHENPAGNAEDVILGFHTSRFMYEAFNQFTDVAPITQAGMGTSTQARLPQVHAGLRTASEVDRTRFNPDLENIVMKALAGTLLVRNEFIPENPRRMNAARQAYWGARATTNDYSYGERAALYLSYAIHIASDLAQRHFGRLAPGESAYVLSARRLRNTYQAHQTVLDQIMNTKDNDDLIGIYELTSPNNFRNLPVIRSFTLFFHEFATRYIEQLGRQTGNAALRSQGRALRSHRSATLDDLSPAREEIMWERIQTAIAGGYLIVGMGDAHRRGLLARLNAASIRNEEVSSALVQQQTDVDASWVP